MGTDQDWEKWGATEPYFGVITNEKFKLHSLDDDARAEFFQSGTVHVDNVLASCRSLAGPGFAPRSALDFGCGVGRIAIPLARTCDRVVGVDVSQSMLSQAQANAERDGLDNIDFRQSDDTLTRVPETFDLVHTHIVLQHIPIRRGIRLFSELVDRIAPGGMGAIQLTYAKVYRAQGREIREIPILRMAKRAVRTVRRFTGRNNGPAMQMNHYDLNHIHYLLQAQGVRRLTVDYTDHGGELGVALTFQKPHGAST